MAALTKKRFRMCFLEKPRPNLCRWDLRSDGQHGHARAVTIEKPVDQMQVARAAAPGAYRQLAREVRFGAGCKSGDLLMPNVDPFDPSLPP